MMSVDVYAEPCDFLSLRNRYGVLIAIAAAAVARPDHLSPPLLALTRHRLRLREMLDVCLARRQASSGVTAPIAEALCLTGQHGGQVKSTSIRRRLINQWHIRRRSMCTGRKNCPGLGLPTHYLSTTVAPIRASICFASP